MTVKLYSQRDAAIYLTDCGYRVHESELSKMGRYGAGPKYQRLGQQKVFTQDDLDTWLDEQCIDDDNSSEAARPA